MKQLLMILRNWKITLKKWTVHLKKKKKKVCSQACCVNTSRSWCSPEGAGVKSLKTVISSGHLLNYTTQSVFLLTIDNTPVANIVCPLLACKNHCYLYEITAQLILKKYIYINLFLMPKKRKEKYWKTHLSNSRIPELDILHFTHKKFLKQAEKKYFPHSGGNDCFLSCNDYSNPRTRQWCQSW